MGDYDPVFGIGGYHRCHRVAKWITPKDPMRKRKLFVCGIHRRSVDMFQARINSTKRCKPL